jgi:hypothetical protein
MIIGLSRSFSVPGEVRRATEVAFRLVVWTGHQAHCAGGHWRCKILTLCGHSFTGWLGLGRMLEEHRRGDLLSRAAELDVSSLDLPPH